jgi:hypothetical protein
MKHARAWFVGCVVGSIALASSPANAAGVWENSVDGFLFFVDQAANGPGTTPPEGPGFAAGSALSPMTPYDTFSSAPMTPGIAGVGQFAIVESYAGTKVVASLRASVGGLSGSFTNAYYWSENLMPALNPHLSQRGLPYSIVFPTHAGQDPAGLGAGSFDQLAIGAANGSWNLRAGYFDLAQTDRFVFAPAPLTNQDPEIGLAPAETLGNGPPALDAWPSPPPGLPLDGVDLTFHRGLVKAELTDATLPSLPGTPARITNASVFWDRGEALHLSAQYVHLTTGGNPIATTTLFGSDAILNAGPQGLLPTSTLGGQRSTIAGLHGAFPIVRTLSASFDLGRAWYDADGVLEPGTAKPGNFLRAGLVQPLGTASAQLDLYRFEPRYATPILPYGIPENIWSVAWSWPGVWLKSTYQLADNTSIGANRQGYRLRLTQDGTRVDVHASYAEFHQIDPSSTTLSNEVGFVEGFFLPQSPSFVTYGQEKQAAAWVSWHPNSLTMTLDYVDDMMHRDAAPTRPEDAVSYDAPQTVLTLSRSFGRKLLGAAGFGRFVMVGSWAQGAATNVEFQQNEAFAGAQYEESAHAIVLLQLRHTAFAGLPSMPNGPSPDFHDTLLVVEQRFHS